MNNPTVIGTATIYNCDCMDLLKATPDKFYDLAIVDPPYGIGMGGGKVGNSKVDYKQFAGSDKAIPADEYFYELKRVSENMIIWGGNYFDLPPTPCFICWDKVQPEDFTLAMVEFAWTSFKSPAKIYKQRIVGADIERIHPTQKPVALYEWMLTKYAKPNDKILDTHLGSGSHAIACNNLGFELTACELDKDYFDASVKRIKQAMAQDTLFAPSLPSNQVYEQVDLLYADNE